MTKPLSYFVSDVHLGLQVGDAAAREARFVAFLRGIDPSRTDALYLLGDIWDFWYEWRDVVPKGYVQVFAALQELMRGGVKVYFFQGNHDVWTYHYFADMGMIPLEQPYVISIGEERFCLGHGDGLGPGDRGYKFIRRVFHSRFLQRCFSTLHPWIAFRLGNGWSRHSRLAKGEHYSFRGADEPLYRWCVDFLKDTPVQHFIFGHYHCPADLPLPADSVAGSVDGPAGPVAVPSAGTPVVSAASVAVPSAGTPVVSAASVAVPSALHVLGDWMTESDWLVYDAASHELRRQA